MRSLWLLYFLVSLHFVMHFESAMAGPNGCNDERLNAVFKTELKRDISSLCQLADKSRHGMIDVETRNGQIESISCCRNDYELMRISAELRLEEKNNFCADIKSEAAKLRGENGEEFIREKINLSERSEGKVAALRKKLATCHSIGSQCKAVINAATTKIQSELAGLQRLRNAATSDAERKQIDDAVTIGGQ